MIALIPHNPYGIPYILYIPYVIVHIQCQLSNSLVDRPQYMKLLALINNFQLIVNYSNELNCNKPKMNDVNRFDANNYIG